MILSKTLFRSKHLHFNISLLWDLVNSFMIAEQAYCILLFHNFAALSLTIDWSVDESELGELHLPNLACVAWELNFLLTPFQLTGVLRSYCCDSFIV